MTALDDMRLRGRYPEFARMSLKPGIGSDAMWDVASKLLASLDQRADVPSALRQYGKLNPIGRYLRRRLRVLVGRDEAALPNEALEAEMLVLQEAARSSSETPSLKGQLLNASEGQYRQIVARNAIYKKDRPL